MAVSTVERFATPFSSSRANLNFWNEVASASSPGLLVDSVDPGFSGRMYRWRLGDLTLLWPNAAGSIIQRRADVSGGERLLVHLQGQGECLQQHRGRECLLKPGDFSVCTSGLPARLCATPHDMIVVDLPRHHLDRRLPDLDDVIAGHVRSCSPSIHALRQFLLATWRDGIRGAEVLDESWQSELRSVIIDMLALALKGVRSAERARIPPPPQRLAAIVEARLHDPDLSAMSLAGELNVSVRTVQLWFAQMGNSPRAYILDRRMKRSAQRLLTAPFEHVTTIALDHGFNDSAYFTRCFTRHFGCSPSRWRETGGEAGVSR